VRNCSGPFGQNLTADRRGPGRFERFDKFPDPRAIYRYVVIGKCDDAPCAIATPAFLACERPWHGSK
jgi:hypothetical protein